MKGTISTKDKETIIVKVPGRTCLFGDHQDYLELPVIACAISRHITLKAKKNANCLLNIDQPDIGEKRSIDLNKGIITVEKDDFFIAAIDLLADYGCYPDQGYDIVITGNIPINAGTSSSSALVVAWVEFLITSFGCDVPVTPKFVAEMAYQAEVVYHGMPGGKMDQYSIGLGHVIYLETGTPLYYETFEKFIPGLIVGVSGIPKDTSGVLRELRDKAQLSVLTIKKYLKEFDLSKVSIENIGSFLAYVPEDLQVFFVAAVRNHSITREALLEFRRPTLDLKKIGALMLEHHGILRDYLNITVPLIDNMVDAALEAGAYGAKIVGSGRGGCIVVLSPEDKEDTVIASIRAVGAKDAFTVQVDPGARVKKINN
ncbi:MULTISPECIES: galactokinase family protein [unclassified Allomuricauda]|uniref:GHMP family kinase ATP-binding protein n=1 Tax=Flavobacteriaceae TaxID=49546 RepID=UPI00273E2144|nr:MULTISPECIES: galactokinase family protein [unclassified Allomuricauda]